ncbi:hypothetical protein ASG12_07685 [Williamsia sp. Leaf354]|uniref:hypothetical protein n=1 Tax=Williamsia sp. Leaf354 TaxID=1736349 RepID=UPI0006FA36AB|nr:hypothetical protein [Williamsia sp. Leaf354]KQS00734.1 hypothetical protein ASG12_07685 [Williamsia sp. Leaf354]
MIFTGAKELRDVLSSHGQLSESLMTGFCLVNNGFSALIEFEIIVDASGRPITEERTLRIVLVGVAEIVMHGGLNDHIKANPGAVNWGLSEVALVEVSTEGADTVLLCQWEGSRSLRIQCGSAVAAWSREELRPHVDL